MGYIIRISLLQVSFLWLVVFSRPLMCIMYHVGSLVGLSLNGLSIF